jgi:hypothetical protein
MFKHGRVHVKSQYFDEMSEVKTNDWEAKVSTDAKLPEPESMSNVEKEKLLASAKINVSIEEKSQ